MDRSRAEERRRAGSFGRELDLLLAGQLPLDARAARSQGDEGLLVAAARLAALPKLMPSPEADLEQRVLAGLRELDREAERPRARWRRPLLRALAPVALALLLLILALPGPRQALSNWMATFQLQDVQVVMAPERTVRPELAAESRQFASMVEAEQATGMGLLEPAYMPPGYSLAGVEAVTYGELPVWLQPLYVEIVYRPGNAQEASINHVVLREFNARRGDQARLDQIEFQSEQVRSTTQATLSTGLAALLVELEPEAGSDDTLLRQVIWQQEGLTLELWSQALPFEDLLRIAESLH